MQVNNEKVQNFITVLKRLHKQQEGSKSIHVYLNSKNKSTANSHLRNYSGTVGEQSCQLNVESSCSVKYGKRSKIREHNKTQISLGSDDNKSKQLQKVVKMNLQSHRQLENLSWSDNHCRKIKSDILQNSQNKLIQKGTYPINKNFPQIKLLRIQKNKSPVPIKKVQRTTHHLTNNSLKLQKYMNDQKIKSFSIALHLPITSSKPFLKQQKQKKDDAKLNKFTKYCQDICQKRKINQNSPRMHSQNSQKITSLFEDRNHFYQMNDHKKNQSKKINKIKLKIMQEIKHRIKQDSICKQILNPEQNFPTTNPIINQKYQNKFSFTKLNIQISQKFAPKIFQFKTSTNSPNSPNSPNGPTPTKTPLKISPQTPTNPNPKNPQTCPSKATQLVRQRMQFKNLLEKNGLLFQRRKQVSAQRRERETEMKIDGWEIRTRNNLKSYGVLGQGQGQGGNQIACYREEQFGDNLQVRGQKELQNVMI